MFQEARPAMCTEHSLTYHGVVPGYSIADARLERSDTLSRVAVLGGGGFGCAAAAHLTLQGHEVTLLLHPGARQAGPVPSPRIHLTGILGEHDIELHQVTADPAEAIPGRSVVLFAAPGAWYEDSVRLIAPHLREGQLLLVNNGLVGVALRLSYLLEATRTAVHFFIGEMAGQTYASRGQLGGTAELFLISKPSLYAAMPATDTTASLPLAADLYPGLTPAQNVLETSLSGLAAILYPPPILFNAGRIQQRQQRPEDGFRLFAEGVTPAVAEAMHAADEERMAVLRGAGLRATGLLDWLTHRGHLSPEEIEAQSFYEAFHRGGPLGGVKAPESLEDDYFLDAVGSGLVPLAELGQLLNVGTPVFDALITLGSLVTGRSYRTVGLTVDRMGLPREPWKLDSYLAGGRR